MILLTTCFAAINTAKEKANKQLVSQLPYLTETSLEGSHGYALQLLPKLQEHINQQLSASQQQRLNLVQCHVKLLQLAEGDDTTATLQWQSNLTKFNAHYFIRCTPVAIIWLSLLTIMLIFLALLWRFSLVLPTSLIKMRQLLHKKGVTTSEQHRLLQLSAKWNKSDWQLFGQIETKLNSQFAIELVEKCRGNKLDNTQLAWLLFAAEKFPNQAQQVLEIALGEDELRLQLSTGKVWVRGIELTLSITPMLYYYWYASQRKSTEQGWVLNPASNKPNTEYGAQLQQLMLQGPGHKKAITDVEQGAKAKTLDQNRSKIRDELTQQLGPELAKHYLFECHKDVKTNRFYYRIMTAPSQIKLLP